MWRSLSSSFDTELQAPSKDDDDDSSVKVTIADSHDDVPRKPKHATTAVQISGRSGTKCMLLIAGIVVFMAGIVSGAVAYDHYQHNKCGGKDEGPPPASPNGVQSSVHSPPPPPPPHSPLPPGVPPAPPPPHLPAIVPATVKLHDLDPQWRFVHGYWQGTCVDIDEHGDGGTPYARHVVASTSGSEYSEQLIKAGDSSWTTDVQGEVDYLQSSKTTVDFKSTTTNGVLSRTTAAGNDNSMHTFFYDEGGVFTHSRLISFRVTAGVMRRIVSTQSFTDGFAPSGLVECKDVKLAGRAAADAVLASDSLPGTSAPELFAAVTTTDFIHPYAQCNATAVVLADYPQYVQALQTP